MQQCKKEDIHDEVKLKSFPSNKAHRVVLISISLALSQTPVYTVTPYIGN